MRCHCITHLSVEEYEIRTSFKNQRIVWYDSKNHEVVFVIFI